MTDEKTEETLLQAFDRTMEQGKTSTHGWIAYRSPQDFLPLSFRLSERQAEDVMLLRIFGFPREDEHETMDAFYERRNSLLCQAANLGWRIRPVKLVFLDEEGKE
jgi:hypothetical protein